MLKAHLGHVSISKPAFCTLSQKGRFTHLLMWLRKRIEEKGGEVRNVSSLVQSFLASISS
jgi:hypothetical protein